MGEDGKMPALTLMEWGICTTRNLRPKLEVNLHIKVGDGKRTRFWRDIWINQLPLKDSYPDLFLLCNNPEAWINEFWTAQGTNSEPDSVRRSHNEDGVFTADQAYKMESLQQSNNHSKEERNDHSILVFTMSEDRGDHHPSILAMQLHITNMGHTPQQFRF
ncbi:hypothetical protein H5410_012902 [Solanum commersonii]|uniref:Uncharacterized protein n=1 Tax=Solanum commersonii TaxID=4109 RepID=A0A9J6ATF9_SOLCO|nr:hypothetical protein H5410_012902 [Solanum commersonii]